MGSMPDSRNDSYYSGGDRLMMSVTNLQNDRCTSVVAWVMATISSWRKEERDFSASSENSSGSIALIVPFQFSNLIRCRP